MSFQAITSFFEKVAGDTDLEQAVQSALDNRAEAAAFEIVDIGRSQGCDFTATELREYLVSQAAGAELSEDQLEAVAGGILSIRSLNLSDFRRIRMLSADKLRII